MGFNPVENFLTWLSQGGGDSMGFTGSLAQNLPVNQIEQEYTTGPPAYDRNLPIRDESPLYDDYVGGEFQYSDYTEEKVTHNIIPSKKMGTIFIFPSFKEHRITSITKGIRYSLVTWFLGPPFK